MGWFAIACVVGYLAWSVWRLGVLPQLDTSAQVAKAGVVALIAFAIALVVWATAIGDVATLAQFVDKIGEGAVARFVFGVALGFGVGHLIGGTAGGAPAQGGGGQPAPAAAETRPNQALLTSVGLTLLILALIAPHSDRWLRNLSGLKTSVIEVQLSRISTASKQVAPDYRQLFIDHSILRFVQDHARSIERDIQLVNLFVIPNTEQAAVDEPRRAAELEARTAKLRTRVAQMEQIHKVFETVVSPLARCVIGAIDRGLDIESARGELRPLADLLIRIISLEDEGEANPAKRDVVAPMLETVRTAFRRRLVQLPQTFSNYLPDPARTACAGITAAIEAFDGSPALSSLPPYTHYKQLPHLFSAMSFLLLFVNNDGQALNVMERAQGTVDFEDLQIPQLRAKFMYFKGAAAAAYMPLFERARATASRQRSEVQQFLARCERTSCPPAAKEWAPKLLKRARLTDVYGMNDIAYGIAQDLAAGLKGAGALQPIAEDYADKIARAIERPDFEDDLPPYLDTVAFVTIVTEVQKSAPDQKKIQQAVATLTRLVAQQEAQIAATTGIDKSGYVTLNLLRAHLASARGLLED